MAQKVNVVFPRNMRNNLRETSPLHLTLCSTVEAGLLSDLYDIMKEFRFPTSLTIIDETNLFGVLIACLLVVSIPKCEDRKSLSIKARTVLQKASQIQHIRKTLTQVTC